jgi:hypothetical protein
LPLAATIIKTDLPFFIPHNFIMQVQETMLVLGIPVNLSNYIKLAKLDSDWNEYSDRLTRDEYEYSIYYSKLYDQTITLIDSVESIPNEPTGGVFQSFLKAYKLFDFNEYCEDEEPCCECGEECECGEQSPSLNEGDTAQENVDSEANDFSVLSENVEPPEPENEENEEEQREPDIIIGMQIPQFTPFAKMDSYKCMVEREINIINDLFPEFKEILNNKNLTLVPIVVMGLEKEESDDSEEESDDEEDSNYEENEEEKRKGMFGCC